LRQPWRRPELQSAAEAGDEEEAALPLLDGRIHLITGKGGVGRTTIAGALARAAALEGRRVLLAETGEPGDEHSAVGRTFHRHQLTDKPERVAPGIDACQLRATTGHELFAAAVIPAGPVFASVLRSKPLRRFMAAAPSFHELGILYHFLTLAELRDGGGPRYDTVIVDMPATGHALALSALPAIVLRVVPRGPIAEAMRRGQRLISDARLSGAWVVTLPETLPVTEAIELVQGLRDTAVPVRGIILNRTLADPFDAEERGLVEGLVARGRIPGQLLFERIAQVNESMARLEQATGLRPLPVPEVPHDEGEPQAVLTSALRALTRAEAA
jgi:arsenite-transporting ATPase